MKENYTYPIDYEAPREEILAVIAMFQVVEEAYEKGIVAEKVLAMYEVFKKYIKSIGEEKRLGRDFEAVSGYSLYRVVKEAKTGKKKIKL